MGSGPYRQVLLVEDEPTLRRVVARNLTGRGLQVREADTAEAAIGAATTDRPDLLLLDINLPDRSGWDVLRELRRRGSDVPTIIVSAVRVSPNRLEEFHPLAYLPKPFPLEALLRLVLGGAPSQWNEDSIVNSTLPSQLQEILEESRARPELVNEKPLRVAASTLSRAPLEQMTATTVVGVLARDDVEAFRDLVQEIANQYGLDAQVKVNVGSFSVRFERGGE